MRKTALYTRVASVDNDASEWQIKSLKLYAKQSGFDNITIYSDNGESGCTLERPALSALISDVKAGKIEKVIVKDIARLSRNTLQFNTLCAIFLEHNVELITLYG